jgi:putative FmdB family regulatory protein
MPLYEYECTQCGHRFELIQRFADPLADTCASCGKVPVHKLLSAPAVHFKGTGWYVTDYAKKGSEAAGKSEGAAAESKAAATETTAADDKKPAAASESKPAADSSK